MTDISGNPAVLTIVSIFAALTLLNIVRIASRRQFRFGNYLNFIWMFFLIFSISEVFSFYATTWLWGILCFLALREYFSLVDIRLQDRLGILAAYISIPFMMRFIHTNWYNMFVISIPVYAFLVIPFLISIAGREIKGTVNSIGIIDFGLFLFVFCIGHIAYLSRYSAWKACLLILSVVICDLSIFLVDKKVRKAGVRGILKYCVPVPFTVALAVLLCNWTGIPKIHSVILGLMIPALVIIGNRTIRYITSDLGITREGLKPGKGLIIDSIKSIVYTAPVVFHYIRYFVL